MSSAELPPVIQPPAGAVPYDQALLRLWGDDESGLVNDWIYVCNTTIQQTVLSMGPGQHFHHSSKYRTVLGADELYYILKGSFALANPQTGEVHRAEQGQALYFHKDTWHHGFNCGEGEVRILEYFAPPGPGGGSQAYASKQPLLSRDDVRYTQDQWLGAWPAAACNAAQQHTQHLVTADKILWRLEGYADPMIVGIYFSTPNLTVGRAELRPGQVSEIEIHGGDEVGYVLNGRLNVFFPGEGEVGRTDGEWYEMHPRDGFFIPEATRHQYFNMTGETVRFMFAVGQSYLPAAVADASG